MATTLTEQNLSNMAHLLVHLLVTKSLSLSVLKAGFICIYTHNLRSILIFEMILIDQK